MSTHQSLSQLTDFDDDEKPDVPSLPNADVVDQDVLEQRDAGGETWDRALDVDRDDVQDGARRGVWYVDEMLCILVTTEDGDWRGWCQDHNTDESTCYHLCALAQLDVVDDIVLPEVRFA